MLTQVQTIAILVGIISFVAGVIFRSRFKNSGEVNDALLEDVDTLEDAVKEWREKFYELQERIVHDFPTYFSVNAKGPLIKENPISKPITLVDILMQVKSKGLLMRNDAMQLYELGFPVYMMIATHTASSGDRVKKYIQDHGIGFEILIESLISEYPDVTKKALEEIKEIEQRQVYDKYSKGEWVDRQLKSLKVSEGVIKDNLKTIKAIEKTNGSKRGLVVGRQFVVDSINRGHGSDAQD